MILFQQLNQHFYAGCGIVFAYIIMLKVNAH